MAFPDDLLAPVEGALGTATGLTALTAIVPAVVTLTELAAMTPENNAFNAVKSIVTSATTATGALNTVTNPAGPLAAVNGAVMGVYNSAAASLVTGPLGSAATAAVTAANQLPVQGLATTVTSALPALAPTTAILLPVAEAVALGVVPVDGLDGIVDAVNDTVSVTGTVPAVLTAAGNLYNTLTSPGSSGLLGSSGPLAIINNDVNAIRTALSPVAAIAQVSPVVTAAQTLLNTSWETSAVSGLVNSTIGGGFLGAGGVIGTFGALSPLAPSSPVGYVNQAVSGVLGTVNPAVGVVNSGTGAGTGLLDGVGDTTHGLPLVGDALDGVALPDVLGADSPLNTVNDLLGGDTTHLLDPVTDLLGGADPTGGLLSPVTDLLGGAGAGDPTAVLSPVTDLLGGAGAGDPTALLSPVTDALGDVTGGGDPTGGITDAVLGDHGVVGGLLGGGDPTGGLLAGLGV